MSKRFFRWLIISPDIFVDFLDGERLLMYNTSKGDFMCSSDKRLYDIVSRLYLPQNLGVIPYGPFFDSVVDEAVRKGLLSVSMTKNTTKPISILPILSLQKDLERDFDDKYARLGNKLYYLSGLYVSLDCCVIEDESLAHYRNMASMQYPCAHYDVEYARLELVMLEKLLAQLKSSSVSVVDFVCSHRYFLENKMQEFIKLLARYPFKYRIRIYAEDYALMRKQDVLALSSICQFFVYMDCFTAPQLVKEVTGAIANRRIFKLVYQLSDLEQDGEVCCLPVWTDENEQMFRKIVWTSETDLKSSPRSMSYLFRNQKLNSSFFGILDVSYAGDICPHGSFHRLGNFAFGFTLVDAVSSEFRENHSWRITRKDLPNCRSCHLRYVCPPVSISELMRPDIKMCNHKCIEYEVQKRKE